VADPRIMRALGRMAELAVMAERRQVRADTRIVALRLAMNADLAVMASLGWMNDRTRRAGSLCARYIRTADAPVMSHRARMRADALVAELRIMRAMTEMAVLRVVRSGA